MTHHSPDTPPASPEVILVVDDTEGNRYVTAQWLERAGYRVVTAATGAEALALAGGGVDLVLLDVHLPDLHGFEVATRLKSDPRTAHIPVIHLSAGQVSVADRVSGLEAGADGYLTHPVEPQELVAHVRAMLRLAEAHRALRESAGARERALAQAESTVRELEMANALLQEQAFELELSQQQLEEQAAELEAQAEELSANAAALEERTEEAERARRAAAASERQLRTVFAQAPAAVAVTTGPDHRFVLVNPLAERISGRTDLVGRPYRDAFPELEAQGFAALLDQVYASGEPFIARATRVLLALPGGGHEEIWLDFTYQPLRDAEGRVTGIMQHVVDVSEQVRAREALLQSERQFHTLADAIPTLAWTARADGFIDWYNARWYEYTGTTPEQMEGWGWQSVHDTAALPAVLERWTASIASGRPFEMTFPLLGADGHFRRFLTRVMPVLDDAGTVVRWFGTNTDVEAERIARATAEAAETRLRDIFEQAPVAVAVLSGPEHVYTIVSPLYAQSPGTGRPLLGRSVREAFPEADYQGLIATMDDVYRTGEPYFAQERRVLITLPQSGAVDERFFNVGYQPLRDAAGEVYAIASVTYDVTTQVRARREVDAARQEADRQRATAEEANRAKSQFLSTMSHELRTPLNAIEGYTQLLVLGVRGALTETQQLDLERIRRANQHLTGLVTDILNFARLEAGQVKFELTDVELGAVMADLEPLVGPQLAGKGLRFDHDSCAFDTPERPHAVRADPEKLRQVLLNLITNAIKFTDPGGRIAVACDTDAEAGVARITVADTGRGIPADQHVRIFEPFVQVDRQRTPASQQGVGLGLAISRDLARGMDGELTVASTVGEGSTFTLVLPLA